MGRIFTFADRKPDVDLDVTGQVANGTSTLKWISYTRTTATPVTLSIELNTPWGTFLVREIVAFVDADWFWASDLVIPSKCTVTVSTTGAAPGDDHTVMFVMQES